jgi:hypothetical protein
MLFKRADLDRIARGETDLALRRWKKPTVKMGGRLRTAIGELAIGKVEQIDAVSARDAKRAGFADVAAANAILRGDGELYRIEVGLAGADTRIALRKDDKLDAEALTEIAARLDRMDKSSRSGAWTRTTLALIAKHPGTRAPDLAASQDRETLAFKRDVRKLKELGLTESLEVGYRVSPRGKAFLAAKR